MSQYKTHKRTDRQMEEKMCKINAAYYDGCENIKLYDHNSSNTSLETSRQD